MSDKRLGRPPLTDGQPTSRVSVSLPLSARDALDQLARREGVPTAEFIRKELLGRISAAKSSQTPKKLLG